MEGVDPKPIAVVMLTTEHIDSAYPTPCLATCRHMTASKQKRITYMHSRASGSCRPVRNGYRGREGGDEGADQGEREVVREAEGSRDDEYLSPSFPPSSRTRIEPAQGIGREGERRREVRERERMRASGRPRDGGKGVKGGGREREREG